MESWGGGCLGVGIKGMEDDQFIVFNKIREVWEGMIIKLIFILIIIQYLPYLYNDHGQYLSFRSFQAHPRNRNQSQIKHLA